jgi:hypothetical protein
VLIGCGNNGDSDSNVYGIAQLGNLGDAEVKIYKIEENGSKTLKWTERTSEGKSLKSIGLFNSHSNELEDNVYYLYEISGGKDWDSDDDGKKDWHYTNNRGVIRAIYKGSDLKKINMFNVDKHSSPKVNIATEIVYQKIKTVFENNFSVTNLENNLSKVYKYIVPDINKDGKIDRYDAMFFNPVKDKLRFFYQKSLSKYINSIHNGDNIAQKITLELNEYKGDFNYGTTHNHIIADDELVYIARDNKMYLYNWLDNNLTLAYTFSFMAYLIM